MSSKDGPKTKKIFVGGIPSSLTEGTSVAETFFVFKQKISQHCIELANYNNFD